MQDKNVIEIFTDGACQGNPGPGGWGAVFLRNGKEETIAGRSDDTTNNRMEMTAAIEALRTLPDATTVKLTTDSQYLRLGITTWIHNWKRRNWMTASKKPVKNLDLWKQLDLLTQKHNVTWYWVKGHSDNKYNNMADLLATQAIHGH
ncbi:MAG: ribonuclease HI [Thiotrichales bacterium]|nr:MAG: ribonuclease HI [Thiotrichales bacterium]